MRSHTKEKSSAECTKCFTRRDLLLRHQQKLHAAKRTFSQSRAEKKESVSGATISSGKRARKISVINNGKGRPACSVGASSGPPRANTIGHTDLSMLGLVDGSDANPSTKWTDVTGLARGHHQSATIPGMPNEIGFGCHAMSTDVGYHFNTDGLQSIEYSASRGIDVNDSMSSAPAVAGFGGFI